MNSLGDPFEAADYSLKTLIADLNAAVLRVWKMEPCDYCGFTYVHSARCLELMNEVRTPTGDWWNL